MGKRGEAESSIGGGDERHRTSTCVAALVRDIRVFSDTSKLPKRLDWFARASEHHQLAWYKEMSNTLKDNPTYPLETPEDATKFVYYSLNKVYPYGIDVSYLMDITEFYGLPHVGHVDLTPLDDDTNEDRTGHKLLLILETLPVTGDRATDGDSFTVSVEVKQRLYLPPELLLLILEHRKASADEDKSRELELLNQINATEDYKMVKINRMDLLTKNYQIRLRGIDGIEARDELLNMVIGKCLTIEVYYFDDDGCCVADVYYDDICLQDKLLENGFEWHDDAELAKWKDILGMESKEDDLAMESESEEDVLAMKLEQELELV